MKTNTLSNGVIVRAYTSSQTLMQPENSLSNDFFPKFGLHGEDLTIVVLSFNRVALTIRLLHSIIRCMPDYKGHILIADNGSSAEQLALLEEKISTINSTHIQLIKYGENRGVAKGRNDAMPYVKTNWVLSLDNDIYLVENPLVSISNAIKMLGAYYINVPLLKPDGKTIDSFGGDLWFEPHGNTYYVSGTSSYQQIARTSLPAKLPFLSTFVFGGASVFYKDHFLKFGGYDTNMFVGFEDTEFSIRLYKEGIKVGNTVSFCFVHAHDAPKNKQDADSEKVRFSSAAIKKSGDYFQQKHGFVVWKKSIDEWIETRFKQLDVDAAAKNDTSILVDADLTYLLEETITPDPEENKPKEDSLNNQPIATSHLLEMELLKREVQLLQEKIKAMETSKFWRLRNRWFSFRKKLRIANDDYSILDRRAYAKRTVTRLGNEITKNPYQYDKLLKQVSQKDNTDQAILVFIPFMVVGGAETAILQVIKGYKKNNVHISLIASNHSHPEMGDTSAQFAEICPDHYFLEDYANLWNDTDSWKHWKALVYEIIRARKIKHILISNSSYAYSILEDLKKDFPFLQIINPVYSTVGHMLDNIKLEKFIDLTVVENPKVEDYLLRICNRPANKIKRIENGVDTNHFIKPTSTPNRLNNFDIPANKKIITFLGRLSEEKGPDIFIELAAKLKNNHHLHFLVAGGGPMSANIISQIEAHSLNDSLTYIGYCNAIDVLSVSHLLVVPSRMDGRPNVVLESLSMGVPVICSDAGGLPWLIAASSKTGFCLNLESLTDFEQAILALSNDEVMYDQFSKASRQYAVEQLDVSIMQNGYLHLLENNIQHNKSIPIHD